MEMAPTVCAPLRTRGESWREKDAAREVRCDEGAADESGGNADRFDARVSEGTAKKGDFQQARHADVADETAPAVQVARILLARQPRADPLARLGDLLSR